MLNASVVVFEAPKAMPVADHRFQRTRVGAKLSAHGSYGSVDDVAAGGRLLPNLPQEFVA